MKLLLQKQPFWKSILLLLGVFLLFMGQSPLYGWFWNPSKKIAQKGDVSYQNEAYNEATQHYNQALEASKNNPQILYNLGNAHYKKKNFDNAIEHYKNALPNAKELLKKRLHHNMGNTYYMKKDYVKAVEHYKNALNIDDKDVDTKKNLEIALRQLQKQNQEKSSKNNNQKKDQKKDQNQSQNNSNEPKQQNQEKSDRSNEQPKQSPQQQASQNQSSQPDPNQKKSKIPIQMAEKILKELESRDKKFYYGKQRTQKSASSTQDKNW